MRIKTIVDEDFVNYKKPCMYIGTIKCSGKCCIEAGIPFSVCQNNEWHLKPSIDFDDDKLIQRYIENDITKAICFAGLEPFDQYQELKGFIAKLRNDYHCNDTIIIYTGYRKNEIQSWITELSMYKNIIIKFGRYVPGQQPHYDDILGVNLANDEQYAERIS